MAPSPDQDNRPALASDLITTDPQAAAALPREPVDPPVRPQEGRSWPRSALRPPGRTLRYR
jgi:hypothetical protein